jgi:protein ImuA
MSDASAKLAFLRASLAKAGLEGPEKHLRIPLGHAGADRALKGGLQRGALHEIFAESGHEASATSFAAACAARLGGPKHILWIRTDFSALEYGELSATGLLDFGLDPERFLLLRASDAEDALRAANDALSCSALGAVVIELPQEPAILDLVASRRLTLGAAQSNVAALLLRFAAKPDANAAETRWLIRAVHSFPQHLAFSQEEHWGRPVFDAQLSRNRHGPLGHWVMEWNADNAVFREPRNGEPRAANPGAVVSPSSHRPFAAAMESGGASLRSVA